MKVYPRHILQEIKNQLNQTDIEKNTQQQMRVLLCEIIEKAQEALEEIEVELDLQRSRKK